MIALLCAFVAASPAESKRVAVLDFVAVEVDASAALAFTQLVAAELARAGLETVSSKDVAALISLEERKQLLGGYDARASDQVAGLLNARYVVAGSIGKLGAKLLVTAQLLDHASGIVVNRTTQEAKNVDALAAAAEPLVRALLAESGRLQLYDQVAGARVFLDEGLIGVMPLTPVPIKDGGRHRLHVESGEHAPWDQEITIARGQTTRLRVDLVALKTLEERSAARRIGAYATLGGAVVAGVGAALLFWGTFESKRTYDAMDLLLVTQRELDAAASRTLGLYAGAFIATAASAALLATSLYLFLYDPHRLALDDAAKSLRFEPIIAPAPSGAKIFGLSLSGRL
ncbi:MAG: PEGA domain-containing protein [Deltaproteobacteria bacterium]|nr:PEGA domain-containing protein [Deltaproteobacteria bacterium]